MTNERKAELHESIHGILTVLQGHTNYEPVQDYINEMTLGCVRAFILIDPNPKFLCTQLLVIGMILMLQLEQTEIDEFRSLVENKAPKPDPLLAELNRIIKND